MSFLSAAAIAPTAVIPSAALPVLDLLQTLKDGVQLFDTTGQLIYLNDAAAHQMGYASASQYMADPPSQPIWTTLTVRDEAGQTLPTERLPCIHFRQAQPLTERTLHYVDRQQRDRCCAVKSLPLRDQTGAIAYGLVIIHDLTEVADLRQQLHHQNRQLRQITDAVPSMVAYLDAQGCHRYANAAYLNTFGCNADTIQGQSLATVVGPVVYQQLQPVIQQAQQQGWAEWCFPLQDHTRQTRYKHLTVLLDRLSSDSAGAYLLLNDVTAHRQAHDLLVQQADHFQHALEGAAVGIWDWDLARDVLIWSPQQEALFGLLPGSFDGQPSSFLALIDDRDRDRLDHQLQETLHTEKAFAIELRIIVADGSIRWLCHRGQVLRNPQGEAVRLAGIAFDITAQKQAEEKMLHQVQRERLIAQFSQEISRTHKLADVIQQVITEVRKFMAVDRFIIIRLSDKMAGKVQYESHAEGVNSMLDWTLRHTWVVREKFLERYRQGYPIAVTDIHQQRLHQPELDFLEYFGITADLTVPLLQENELWGLLSVHNQQPRDWQGEDHRLLETLGTQIMTAIQRHELHQALTQANQRLQQYAYLDGLTHVANRRRFEQFLSHEWRRLMREHAPLAIIMADIDHFKAYNDLYGHQAGDACLRRVAGALRGGIQRPADMVARYGGEEFVVVLPNTDLAGAEIVAEKMRILIRQQGIPHQGNAVDHIVTLSLGVAAMRPHPLKAPEELIKAADQALYRAKEAGRDRVMTAKLKS